MIKMTQEKTKKKKLTALVSGESLTEIAKLRSIIEMATGSLEKHQEIIEDKKNLEFRGTDSVEITSQEISEIKSGGYYGKGIKEINVSQSGNQIVLFIRREDE